MELSSQGTHVFVSYSHKDQKWLDRVRVHLRPSVREGLLDLWDDSRINAGADWRAEITNALSRARVAILLVSADFLASDFIIHEELPPLLDGAATNGVVI